MNAITKEEKVKIFDVTRINEDEYLIKITGQDPFTIRFSELGHFDPPGMEKTPPIDLEKIRKSMEDMKKLSKMKLVFVDDPEEIRNLIESSKV